MLTIDMLYHDIKMAVAKLTPNFNSTFLFSQILKLCISVVILGMKGEHMG